MFLDQKDRIILSEMALNARIPLKQLAKKIRLQESSTAARLQKLFDSGLLINTYAIINSYKLGFEGFRIYFNFCNTTKEQEDRILKELEQNKAINVLGTTRHNEMVVMQTWLKNTQRFNTLVDAIKQKYHQHITNLQTYNYTGAWFFARKYLNNEKEQKGIHVTYGKEVTYDDLDLTILRRLTEDARIPALTIAKETNKTVRTIIQRIKRLEKEKVIEGYAINIDIGKIGYTFYKIYIIFQTFVPKETLTSFAEKCPNSVFIDEAIAKYDFEFNVEVQSEQELSKILDDLKELGKGFKHLDIKRLENFRKLETISV